jgi:WD40 repeat protein
VAGFRGRAPELEELTRGVLTEGCRVVALLGLGGIGKTILAARLARGLAPGFDRVYWRSLRNAPSPAEWLAGAIGFVAAERAPPTPGVAARLTLLLELLREQRCLLVLDNFETVLQPGDRQGRYREGYADYGTLLERLGESEHRSCLLLTSREAPAELGPLAGEVAPVRVATLAGLATEDGRALLHDKGLSGDADAWAALVGRYGGNGLALKILGETIRGLFGGDIAAFLRYATATYGATFGGLRRLLEAQTDRLSALEHTVLRRLAVAREPVTFPELAAALGPAVAPGAALEAVEALRRRSLLEHGGREAAFTLQPVVLEYVTEQLVEASSEEIVGGRADGLVDQPLLQATAKDYVRRSQERLILAPLLERLVGTAGSATAVADRLLHLLGTWRDRAAAEQGYGPGNAVNLLRLLRGHLRGADLSRLRIRQAYLQEVEMADASLAGAHLSETVLGETFGGVSALAVSADGARIAAGTLGGEVRAWRVADRAPLGAVRGPLGAVPGVALSGDGRLLASGSHDGTARLWEAEGGRPLATLRGHVGAVWGVALSEDGRLVASGGLDGTARLWAAAGEREPTVLRGPLGAVWGVALSADGRLLASGGLDGTVRLWAAEGGRPLATLRGHAGAVWGVALSGDGRLLASGGEDGTVRLWEAAGGRPLAMLRGHADGVLGVAFSRDGRLLANGVQDGTVRLWEVAEGREVAVLRGHSGGVPCVAFSPDGQRLVSGGEDGTVRLWEVAGGREVAVLRGHTAAVPGLAFSPDGRLLVSGGHDGTARLWEVAEGREVAVLRGQAGEVWSMGLSAEPRLVASGGHDGTIRLWAAAAEERPLATLRGHTGGILGVALSADGRLVASGGLDGTVRLWEVAGGREVAVLTGHGAAVLGIAFGPDGRRLTSGSLDGTVKLWDIHPPALLRSLRPDRRYERLDITGLTGITAAQRDVLGAFGAEERGEHPTTSAGPEGAPDDAGVHRAGRPPRRNGFPERAPGPLPPPGGSRAAGWRRRRTRRSTSPGPWCA